MTLGMLGELARALDRGWQASGSAWAGFYVLHARRLNADGLAEAGPAFRDYSHAGQSGTNR